MHEISKEHWSTCKICNKTLIEIKKEYGGGNKYFSHAFIWHIKQHNISLEDYFAKYCNIIRPICECGICNKLTKVRKDGARLGWREYACGRYIGQQEWSERAKTERKGSGNPMYGKKAWNTGLGLEDPRVEKMAAQHRGIPLSEEHKKKISIAYVKSPNKNRHGIPHTEETKAKLRISTLNLIKRGVFKQTNSKPHVAMSVILDELNIEYEEEKMSGHFSFDFYMPKYDIYIEVDGDYWHSNPKFYPNGPKSKSQKINYSRDCSKNKYCKVNNINLYRFWENDILKNRDIVKDQIECTVKQLKQ